MDTISKEYKLDDLKPVESLSFGHRFISMAVGALPGTEGITGDIQIMQAE